MTSKDVTRVGWYSAEQAKAIGTLWYSTPSGGEVEVTEVKKVGELSSFPSAAYCGGVVRYLRDGREPQETDWHATCKRCKGFVPGEALLSGDAVCYVAPVACPRCDETNWKR